MLFVYYAAEAERQVVTCMSCRAAHSLYEYFLSSSHVPDAGEGAKHGVCSHGAHHQQRKQLPKSLPFLVWHLPHAFHS